MGNSDQPNICSMCGRDALPPKKINMCAEIVKVIRERPDLKYSEIAEAFGVSDRTVRYYAQRAGVRRYRRK